MATLVEGVIKNTNAIKTFHKSTPPSPSILERSALMCSHPYAMSLVIPPNNFTVPKPHTSSHHFPIPAKPILDFDEPPGTLE